MSTERDQLEAAISGLEGQRALLGDAVVEAALAGLRARLAAVGSAQPASGTGTQTLRQVTILFLDVVGSTALTQSLDPEDVHAVMDGVLTRCTAIVESHGGKVLQYAGDGLLAAFGVDAAREDDPERAVRTGLALLAEARLLGDEVRHRHGHAGFGVRIGVHTGDVLLGGGVDAEGTIRGLAVNIAARMEQTAPAGALRISHDTYRQVRGVFDVEAQPPLEVKGLDQGIVTYLVLRAKPRAFRVTTRGIEGVETRMVGRDVELQALREAFMRLCSDRKLEAITVVGEAGLGKSRLQYEFQNWAEARPEAFYVFQGRANPQTQTQPYGLLRDILAWRLQMTDNDSMQAAKDKIEQGIAPLFMADDGADIAQAHAHLLGHLIGLDFAESRHVSGILEDPRQIRNRAFHAAAEMFRRISAQNGTPIVLTLEDLHWADDGSLDFLDHLARVNGDVPMLMLGLTRPALFEHRSDWGAAAGSHRRIELAPLAKVPSLELANELLKKLPEVPAALRELITGGAEGNPFFMEELVKMLVDQGAIEVGPESWTLSPARLLATHVPPTLTGVVQARLDGLPPAEKLALQQASVIGLVFWDQALAALDPRAAEALPSLVRRRLVVALEAPSLQGMNEYAFSHQILHHVTYDTLLKRDRRDLHARTAAWLVNLSGSRAGDFLGDIAGHYERGGDGASASEFFARAAESAKARFAQEAALGYVERALALIGEDDHPDKLLLRWRLLLVRDHSLDLQGRRLERRVEVDRLQQLADALSDDRRRAVVALVRCRLAMLAADYHALESAARDAMALAERASDDELRLRAQRALADARDRLGDAEAGRVLAQTGLVEARARGLRNTEAGFLNALAVMAGRHDDSVVLGEMTRLALSISRETGDRQNETTHVLNLGVASLDLGELAQAQRLLEEALRLARAIGDRALESSSLSLLAQLALWRGDASEALARAGAALEIALTVHRRDREAFALCMLGDAEMALGDPAAAAAAFDRAHAAAQSIGYGAQHDATAGRARVALARGDSEAAVQHVDTLLAHLGNGGTLAGTEQPRFVQLTCYQVLARAGDPRAPAVLAVAHADLQARAATITDSALRASFMENIPENRAIAAAWAAHQGVVAGNG